MKKLIFSFLALLLEFSLAWAQVTVSGTITVQGDTPVPSDLQLIVGKFLTNGKAVSLSATSYSVTVNDLYPGYSCYFALGNEWALYGEDYRSADWVFVNDQGAEVNPLILDATSSTLTANLVIKPKGGGDEPTPKASLAGTANYEGNYSTCAYGITVAISGDNYSKSTSTDYNDAYYDKLGCSYGYEFKDLELGTYTLTYSKDNYVTQTQEITISAAEEVIAPSVTLQAKPVEYMFEGYIKYLDADNTEVKVEGAKITAYDGSGEDASQLGEPVYTDADGHWTMTLECKAGARVEFSAEHPNIEVTGRTSGYANYVSGNTVNIYCTRKIPDLLGCETYKVKQLGTVDKPLVEISWTWPQELIDNYKTSEKDGDYQITAIKILRPIGMQGLTQVGEIQPSDYELPATSFIDGEKGNTLTIGETYKYTLDIVYSQPQLGTVRMANDARLTITLSSALAKPDSVTLTLEVNDPAMGTVEGAGKYEKNDQVMIRAKANRGYLFKEWQKGGQTYATTAEYKATLTEDMTLTAVFEERPAIYDSVTINLVINDATMGTVVGDGRYAKGESVTIEATPKAGYAFKQWKSGNMVLSSKKVYTFIANSDSTITAVFEREIVYRAMINCRARQIASNQVRLDWAWPQELKDDYKKSDGTGIYQISSINIGRRTPGQSTPDAIGKIQPQAYTLPGTFYVNTATTEYPLEVGVTYSYYLEVVYSEPAFKTVTVNNDGSDENLSVTVTATVAPVQFYTLTLGTNSATMGEASSANYQYEEGDEATVTAVAKPGYIFQCWKEGDAVVSNANPYTFTMTGNRTLTAEFVQKTEATTATLTLDVNNAAWGTVSGGGDYVKGTQVTAMATPKTGYVFQAWQENGTVVTTDARYTFAITENRTLLAVFASKSAGEEPEKFTISVEANNAAWGTVTGGGDYANGAEVTLTATAKEGYLFKGWEENGQMLTAPATYRFIATANRTLIAVFSDTVNITLLVNDPGMGSVTGAGKYKIGSEVIVKATPNEGYVFQAWQEDGEVVSTEVEYTFTITEDRTLMAVFVEGDANENLELAGVSVYPNPSNGVFNIELPVAATIEVFASNGVLCQRVKAVAGVATLNIERSGIYFLRIAGDGRITIKRIIVR